MIRTLRFGLLAVMATLAGVVPAQRPDERPVVKRVTVAHWTFSQDRAGWKAVHDAELSRRYGVLLVDSTGDDPYLHGPPIRLEGDRFDVYVDFSRAPRGAPRLYWTTDQSSRWTEQQAATLESAPLAEDRMRVTIRPRGRLTQLRIDPLDAPGRVGIRSVRVERVHVHPLAVAWQRATPDTLRFAIRNHGAHGVRISHGGRFHDIGAGRTWHGRETLARRTTFQRHRARVKPSGLPPLVIEADIARVHDDTDWNTLTGDGVFVDVAADGSGARLRRAGHVVGALFPLVGGHGEVEIERIDESSLTITDARGSAELSLDGRELRIRKSGRGSSRLLLRALGRRDQAVFPGLEYLGPRDSSSSAMDIETDDRWRSDPPAHHVTGRYVALTTDRASLALVWRSEMTRPTFDSPARHGDAETHEVSLRGAKLDAVLRIADDSLDDALLWSIRAHGLPRPPRALRSVEQTLGLAERALRGPLRDGDGWGHCVEERWQRQFFADHASTLFRLTGEVPALPRLTPDGAHVHDPSIWLVSGRAAEWVAHLAARARAAAAEQRPDGSFRYEGRYLRGHFEDTASGYCGTWALALLEHAWYTGDAESLERGLRALAYMERFRTPRGAQTWELGLHTPDILASAHAVRAHVLAYEMTRRRDHLTHAHTWAVRGLPFVYLRNDDVAYQTIAVYGATNWRAPLWIGRPVQWCGLVYADALRILAPHDHALPWEDVARGILVAGERMMSVMPSTIGCLPDAWNLPAGGGLPPYINPCALVRLRLALSGRPTGVYTARIRGDVVVAPYPVRIEKGHALIEAVAGMRYQVLLDGQPKDVVSRGRDRVPLD